MSKMGYISYLCETGNEKELAEELGSSLVAKEWIIAHENMRENRDKPSFKVLNEITDENIKESKTDLNKAKKDAKVIKESVELLIKDIERVN